MVASVCVLLMVYSGDVVIYVLPSNIYRINSVLSSLGNFRGFTLTDKLFVKYFWNQLFNDNFWWILKENEHVSLSLWHGIFHPVSFHIFFPSLHKSSSFDILSFLGIYFALTVCIVVPKIKMQCFALNLGNQLCACFQQQNRSCVCTYSRWHCWAA